VSGNPPGAVKPEEALKYAERRLFGLIPIKTKRRALTDDEITTENEQVKLDLRRRIGWFALLLTGGQVFCADVVFILYAWLGMHWVVPTAAIQAWLAATVVQVIGIVLVITRSLFPHMTERPAATLELSAETRVPAANRLPGVQEH
jgi:hypothetical protein